MNIFILTYILWFLSEIVINRRFRAHIPIGTNQDHGSLQRIWMIVLLANSLGIVCAFIVQTPLSHHLLLAYTGLGIIVLGMILRFVAIRSLGRFFTVAVSIQSDHTLKTDGLYRYLRHPSYLGMLLSFIGFGISLNNWVSLFVIAVLIFWALNFRIKIEEQVLLNQFGKEYEDYAQKTSRIIPGVY